MTTLQQLPTTCAACGEAFERTQVMSTFESGPPDLDLRPAPLARELHEFLVSPCGNCGFPSVGDETSDEPGVARVVDAFRSSDSPFNELAEGATSLEHRALLEFNRALTAAQDGIEATSNEMIEGLLKFELDLLGSKDTACHSIEEAEL